MERAFVNRTHPRDVASQVGDLAQLHTLFNQAALRAAHTGRAVLASLVLPFPTSDPLRIFRALYRLYPGASSYWEQPARQVALAGADTALSIQSSGARRFADAALAWQQLRDEAVVLYADDAIDQASGLHGPALFGGFSFDPLSTRTPLWQDFPDGLLILPRLLFRQHKDQATLTLSCLVQATDNLDNLTNVLVHDVTHFLEMLARLPEMTEERPGTIGSSANDQAHTRPEESAEGSYQLRDVWPAAAWKNLVSQTVQAIQQGAYAKIVLAREVEVTPSAYQASFHLASTLQCLRLNYPAANIFAFQRGRRTFIGATPERLVHAQAGQLHTMALAGSAPRGATEDEDIQLGSELLASPKNRAEHEFVTSMLRSSLEHLCSRIWIADTPELLRLKNIQHLQTAIVGELLPGRSILEALHMLHPTPAVGGTPTGPALAFIREHEHLDRGWYAGPIGWIDLQGNGDFAVALRSALLEKRRAMLFAGCGIVKDSQPEAEYLESCLKLQVILRSLSGEE